MRRARRRPRPRRARPASASTGGSGQHRVGERLQADICATLYSSSLDDRCATCTASWSLFRPGNTRNFSRSFTFAATALSIGLSNNDHVALLERHQIAQRDHRAAELDLDLDPSALDVSGQLLDIFFGHAAAGDDRRGPLEVGQLRPDRLQDE